MVVYVVYWMLWKYPKREPICIQLPKSFQLQRRGALSRNPLTRGCAPGLRWLGLQTPVRLALRARRVVHTTYGYFPPWLDTRLASQGTKVCRYNWHSAGSLGWPFSVLKYSLNIYFPNKKYGSNFIKQHPETVMVWNYQNADCSLEMILLCHLL